MSHVLIVVKLMHVKRASLIQVHCTACLCHASFISKEQGKSCCAWYSMSALNNTAIVYSNEHNMCACVKS